MIIAKVIIIAVAVLLEILIFFAAILNKELVNENENIKKN